MLVHKCKFLTILLQQKLGLIIMYCPLLNSCQRPGPVATSPSTNLGI